MQVIFEFSNLVMGSVVRKFVDRVQSFPALMELNILNCFAHDEPTHSDKVTEIKDHHDELDRFETQWNGHDLLHFVIVDCVIVGNLRLLVDHFF